MTNPEMEEIHFPDLDVWIRVPKNVGKVEVEMQPAGRPERKKMNLLCKIGWHRDYEVILYPQSGKFTGCCHCFKCNKCGEEFL